MPHKRKHHGSKTTKRRHRSAKKCTKKCAKTVHIYIHKKK